MEKPFDLKYLGEKMKEAGLDIAEESLGKGAVVFFDFLDESAKLSQNMVVKLVASLLPEARKAVLEQIDKIDGKVDPLLG